jgi:hypothetical protein
VLFRLDRVELKPTRTYDALAWLDSLALRAFPLLERYCWSIVMVLEKSETNDAQR